MPETSSMLPLSTEYAFILYEAAGFDVLMVEGIPYTADR